MSDHEAPPHLRRALDETAEHINQIGALFPGQATPRSLRELGLDIWVLERSGYTHFGGAHVFAWWLLQRCRPPRVITQEQRRRLARRARGSDVAYRAYLAAAEGRHRLKRLDHGWTWLDVVGYVERIAAERGATRVKRDLVR